MEASTVKPINFLIWLGVGMSVFFLFHEDTSTLPTHYQLPAEFNEEVTVLKRHLAQKQFDDAMPLISKLLKNTTETETPLKAWLLTEQGRIFQQRRHFHHAINAYKQAKHYMRDTKHHSQHIKHLQAIIDGMQTERHLNSHYLDARNIGMARQLKHQVTIAYFYLDDNKWTKWSAKTRQQNQLNLEQVTQWYKEQAAEYGIDNLDIKVRYFFIRSPNGIAKEWLRAPAFFSQAQHLITQQLGYQNFTEFSQVLTADSPFHQLALVFHANNQSRSFASVCHNRCHTEYVMLTEKMNNNPFAWATSQVQSHEILHLFGAMDLYTIRQAKDFAVTDLMNYYSQSLKYATIDPITAWAIGWQAHLPKTPFKVDVKQE